MLLVIARRLACKLAARRFGALGGAFGMQAAVSAAGLALGVGMLASGRGDTAIYLPVVTSIIGYWLPAPRPASSANSGVSSQSSVADRRPSASSSSSASDKTA